MMKKIAGIIEGFYGDPYSHEERLALIDTIATWNWNSYVWAAKLEPRHRDEWLAPFTSDELQQFSELSARQEDVMFVIGLTPGSGATNEQVITKLRPAITAGAGAVMLCFDDLPVLDAASEHQRIAHAVLHELHVPVWITPTHYAGITSSPYLEALCNGLDERVELLWTGDQVVCDTITATDARARIAATGGRAPLVWDNAPVNDALMHAHLHLGPFVGRDAELRDLCSGFLWNPMVECVASRVMLESAAAWWNGNDAIAAWNTAVDRDGWRLLAEATSYRGEPHWPGETPSRQWWEAVRDMPDLDADVAPWVESARAGARLAVAALTVLESDIAEMTEKQANRLMGQFLGWSLHTSTQAFTFGRGPRQRPLATQNEYGKFFLRAGSVAPSESLVDLLVIKALAAMQAYKG
ncbi:unannotated protein [freshwater metagenome]|uniref:Unannotated protein n=1 Tax=freshwater metagenome TaxID=449393 RepID=A0A6J6G1Y5_9ZZZZ|nr:hypothetical protein [Actinomycetota bacterium]